MSWFITALYGCYVVCDIHAQSCIISQFPGDIIVGFASAGKQYSESNDRHDVHTGCGERGKVTWVGRVAYKISKRQYLVDLEWLGRNDQLYKWVRGLFA